MLKQADIQKLLNEFDNSKLANASEKRLESIEKKAIKSGMAEVQLFLSSLPVTMKKTDIANMLMEKFNITKEQSRSAISFFSEKADKKFVTKPKDIKKVQKLFVKNNFRKCKTKTDLNKAFSVEFNLKIDSSDTIINGLMKDLNLTYKKSFKTPLGIFLTVADALIAHGKSVNTRCWLDRQRKNDPKNFYCCDVNGKRIKE